MKITLIREKRKTIVLRLVDSENAILKAPKSISDKKISEFLEERKNWLEQKSKQFKQNEEFSKGMDFENWFYLYGQKVEPFDDLILGFDKLSKKEKALHIKKFYLSHFSNLEQIAKALSEEAGFSYGKIKPVDSKRIWGSFSSARVMKLNWRLLLIPEKLVKYVIYHELCHSKHMNHKPQFWQEVSRFCPDYKILRKELDKFSFLLKATF